FRRRLRFALGQGQHGAATFGRTAKATVLFAQLFRLAPLNDEGVVEEEFFALGDVAQTVDVEPAAGFVFAGFAVRAAGMVDPARIVAALAAIHNHAVAQRKEEGMVGIFRPVRRQGVGLFLRDAATPIFNDAGFGRDVAG